jgi:energy-coupling factor transporter ATP-binding protein EcfA2
VIALVSEYFTYDDGGPRLLAGVELAVAAGEYVVVAGASSAGKTTLARLLAGRTGADGGGRFRGTLALGGETVRFGGVPGDPRIDPAAWSARVGFVAQGSWGQLSMMSASVAEEIAFGPANRGVPAPEMRSVVTEVAAAMGLTDLLGRDPRQLSGGQLQRTVVAAAVAGRPEVLILDEPFQGLDSDAARRVTEALDGLRASGTAVVVCEPMLPRSAPPDTRVLALADSRTVFAGPLVEAHRAGLRRYGIGTAGDAPRPEVGGEGDAPRSAVGSAADAPRSATGTVGHAPRPGGGSGPRTRPGAPTTPGRELVTFTGVGFRHADAGRRTRPAGEAAARRARPGDRTSEPHGIEPDPMVLQDVHLSVRAGEIVAIGGANGSGKSTLLQHLNGLHRAQAGSVVVDGVAIACQPTGALAGHVGYLFQDTDQQLFERTVLREVSYGPALAGRRREDATSRASGALARVGLGAYEEMHPHELGFVQRRLVAMASIIATGPVLWALDEPTSGLDDRARNLMAGLILEHAVLGGAVIMATHDDAFAEAVAHRRIRLEGGRVLLPD